MKKVLSCLLAVLLLASLGAMAFADDVVPSVEAENAGPAVAAAVDAAGNDVANGIVITYVEDKDTLSEEAEEQMDMAIEALEDIEALAENNEDLQKLLEDGDVDVETIFDVSIVGEVELPVDLQLTIDNADNFAALLHFVDGVPEVIEAGVEDDVLSFSFDQVGTYAILSFVEAE